MKRVLLFVLPVLLAALLRPGSALAHAHLIRADLAPNSHLKVSVGTVRFWFDEPLNPALSRVAILNVQGHEVNVDSGAINPTNDEELDLQVPTLPDGTYSVRWTSDSAQDGHVLHGFYLFTVGGPGAVALGTIPAAIAGSSDVSLDSTAVIVALAHWLVLIGSMLWTGAIALELLVLAPDRLRRQDAAAGLAATASSRTGTLVQLGLLATLASSAIELAAQSYAAAGDWRGLTSGAVLGDILSSRYGTWFVVRILLALLALLVVGSRAVLAVLLGPIAPRRTGVVDRPLGTVARYGLTVMALAYLLALALSGHAAAVPQMTITSVALD